MRALPIYALVWLALTLQASASLLYQETFSADGSIDDYTGAGKIFTAYSSSGTYLAEASGGQFSLGLIANQAGSLYTYTSFGSARPLLSMQVEFTLNGGGAADSAFRLFLGSFGSISDFGPNWNVHNGNRNWAFIRNSASNTTYSVSAVDGVNTSHVETGPATGQSYTWSLFLNQSGVQETYLGPDGNSHTLNANTWSFFIGSDIIAQSVPKGTLGDSANIQGLVFELGRNYDGGSSNISLGNIIIRDDLALVPEPATTALLTLGGMFLLFRRRR